MAKKYLSAVFLLMMILTQGSVANDKSDQERKVCKYGADHMVEIARQSLKEKSSRPERIAKRRILVNEWSSRLERGEDPCRVYADIQRKATTF